jgi:hypothetical protein
MKDARSNQNTFSNPFFIATVVNNKDPENAYRVKVRIPYAHDNVDDNNLPWAAKVGCPFLGFGDNATFLEHSIPEIGTKVLCLAVANDPNSLLYIGALYSKNNTTEAGNADKFGIYSKSGDFIGVDKINKVFEMLWNGDIELTVSGNILMKNGGKIQLGEGAIEKVPLGDSLKAYIDQIVATFNTHTHTLAGVPTEPTQAPIPPNNKYLSKTVTVKG